MKGKFYLPVYLCALLSVSCSSSLMMKNAGSSSCGPEQACKTLLSSGAQEARKPRVCFASLVSESCERGALAGFFNSKAKLACKENANLPARELKFPLARGVLSSPFGFRRGSFHAGIDITADRGDPVFACSDGVVIEAGVQNRRRGMGIFVTLDHGKGIFTDYAHLSRVLVSPGQRVRQGQKIGLVGRTGRATCPHLHLQVRNGAQFYDPMIFFNQSQLSGLEIADTFLIPARERLPKFKQRIANVQY